MSKKDNNPHFIKEGETNFKQIKKFMDQHALNEGFVINAMDEMAKAILSNKEQLLKEENTFISHEAWVQLAEDWKRNRKIATGRDTVVPEQAEPKITYYLFGQTAVDAYNIDDNVQDVIDSHEDGSGYSVYSFDPDLDPTGGDLLSFADGWEDYTEISKSEYNLLNVD